MLDDLVDLIETLKKRIDRHGGTLREIEIRTRMALVDPLLCALGWDTSDPDVVKAEYPIGNGRVDYALLEAGAPIAIVEAKKLGEPLDDSKNLNQMLTYANAAGSRYAAITDGDHWQLYRVFGDPAPIEERKILHVQVAERRPVQCAVELVALWRGNLSGGHLAVPKANRPADPDRERPKREQNRPRIRPGTPISKLKLQRTGNPTPRRLRFPNGEAANVTSWPAVLEAVVQWLIDHNRIPQLPLKGDRGAILLNTKPRNSRGNDFTTAKKVGGLYFEGNLGPTTAVSRSIAVLEQCQEDPSQVYIEL